MDADVAPSELLQTIRLDGRIPSHIAVIMDGNGRWARARGLARMRGHAAGMKSVREAIEGAIEAGVGVLTLYAFSQENWNRPVTEVAALMGLLQRYVVKERAELKRQGVRVRIFGDRDRLAAAPMRAIEDIERVTDGGRVLQLNLMISYGSRSEIVRAARRLAEQVQQREL
ncbi:MAG: polyprenyl diphosphate synthase, partial [Longimicrobiales bacterium]